MKKQGRVKLICNVCEKDFSTHSSNRKKCHTCQPKCKEKHYFFAREINAANKKEGNSDIIAEQLKQVKKS